MKQSFRRIAALLGAILLVGMYVFTFVTAFMDHSAGQAWLKASITATILVPVLLYAILLVERGLRGQGKEREDTKQERKEVKEK